MTISKYRRAFRKPAQQRKKGTRVLSDIDLEDNLGSVEVRSARARDAASTHHCS